MSEALAQFRGDAERLVLEYLRDPRPDLKDMIIVQCASMVERIARRFSGIEPHDDLVQVGYIGLLNALSKFDPEAGVRFNTYATHLVAGEIKHYLRDRTQTIRHPAWLQELRHKVNRAATMLQGDLGRTPTEREIADSIGVSEAAVREVYATQEMLRVASLDVAGSDDDDSETEVDKIDAAHQCPGQMSVEDRVVLENAMTQLRDLERDVLVLFHFESLNQTEIAHRLGISCNYVSHILRQSLNKLRKILKSEDERDRVLRRDVPGVQTDVLDSETGVYGEEYFRTRLTEEMHRVAGTNGVVSVLLIEFGGLAALRNFYGDGSVRDFLSDAAEFLKGSMRGLDVVCRNGSHGFGIILPCTGPGVVTVRERLEAKFHNWLVGRQAANGPVEVRVGHAIAPDDAKSVSDLLKVACEGLQAEVDSSPTSARRQHAA